MPHVFLSYLRENSSDIEALAGRLREAGVDVWVDRDRIKPGERWKRSIRDAIRDGGFFLACFSAEYENRVRTYMNEELALAVEELRLRPASRIWFIPVLLADVEVPELPIGPGETLQDLQWVPLYSDFEEGIRRILHVLGEGGGLQQSPPKRAGRSKLLLPVAGAVATVLGAGWVLSSGIPVGSEEPESAAARVEEEQQDLPAEHTVSQDPVQQETEPPQAVVPQEKKAEDELPDARGTFELILVLPSILSSPDIEVDGKPADVVAQTLTQVTIQMPIRTGGSQISIRKSGYTCTRRVSGTEDTTISITLRDCSRENE